LLLSLLANGTNPDSLKLAARTQSDSTLSDTYYQLARYYFQVDHQPDSMIRYAALAADVALEHHLTLRILLTKKALGLAYTEARKFDLAEKAYEDAMKIAEQSGNVTEVIAINNKLGYLFGVANDLGKSAFYYLNSAREFEKLNDYRNLGLTYKNVVVIFSMLDQLDKIREYTDKSLALVPELDPQKDADILVGLYSNAAQHYFLLGEKDNNEQLIGSALAYADSCLQIGKRSDIRVGLADAYYVISHGYLRKKDLPNTIGYATKALTYRKSVPQRTVFNIFSSISKTYLAMDDFRNAKIYLDSCKLLPVSTELDCPMIIAETEYHLYRKMGKHSEALHALEALMKEKEVIQNSERNKMINDLEVKYQTELKEAKISELDQQARIDTLRIRSLVVVAILAVLIIVVIVVLFKQSTVRNKLKVLETEQRLNRARMNPHFFFNALASLQQYALTGTNGLTIASRLSQFSDIMRKTLESTYHEYITVEKEIAFLQEYLEIQKQRYPASFRFTVSYDPNLEINEIVIQPLIIQPFVENSLEHGLMGMDKAGTITVKFAKNDKELYIEITDNGKGLEKEQEKKNEHISRAMSIIRDRIYLLGKKKRSNARFSVENNEGGEGVAVRIYLPLMYAEGT
jgi:tetratricopeptide (TPR) repeat protein